jgi:hypothetical protein
MSSTNQSFEYKQAEINFLMASTNEEKLIALREMIRTAPKHKSSEKMLANLKTRYVKLKKEIETEKTKKKGRSAGIKKEGDAQVTIFGATKTGKSSLLAVLTNAKPKISDIPYITTKPEIGTLDLDGINIQLIELPAYLENKEIIGIARTSNLIIALFTNLNELIQISNILKKENISNNALFVLNKVENLPQEELKKFFKLGVLRISVNENAGINDLKQKIFERIGLIRIYTKEPGKKPKLDRPMILKKDSAVRNLAEKIRKDFVERFVKARVWGKSAKFEGQTVGIEHVLQDKDIVELYVK